MKSYRKLLWILLSCLSLGLNDQAVSQDASAVVETEQPVLSYAYKDELKRDTPRGAYLGYLAACEQRDFDAAGRFLDLRFLGHNKRRLQGKEYAQKLRYILERTVVIDELSLADRPAGLDEEGIAASRDRLAIIQMESGRQVPVYMDRLWENGRQVWKFSKVTLQHIPELDKVYGPGRIAELLPAVFSDYEFLRLALWQWLFLIVILPLGAGLSRLLVRLFAHLGPHILPRYHTMREPHSYNLMAGPVRLILNCLFYLAILGLLNLTIVTEQLIRLGLMTCLLAGLCWFLARIIDLLGEQLQHNLRNKGGFNTSSVIPLLQRFAKIFLLIITFIVTLQVYSVNVTALLAGLGVGGVAVALAAQKSLENFFSGIALITDQPVRVGDFCRYGNQLGNVEDIGLRSTRIRTIDRSIVTIPNREFSQMKLENLSRRDKMKVECSIGLRYETTQDQLRWVLIKLRELLYSHEKVLHDDRARVRFLGFGDYSLNIGLFAYVSTHSYYEYLEIQEDINLHIMAVIEQSGTSFAFPSRTVYSEPGAGVNADRTKAVEAELDDWRRGQGLPFPHFSAKRISELRHSIPYPPSDSISRHGQVPSPKA